MDTDKLSMLGPTYDKGFRAIHSEFTRWTASHLAADFPKFRFGPVEVGIVGDIRFLWEKIAANEQARGFLKRLLEVEESVGGITLFMLDIFFTVLKYPHIERMQPSYFLGPCTRLDIPRNKILPCPQCKVEGESLMEETELTCPECGHQWTCSLQNLGEAVMGGASRG